MGVIVFIFFLCITLHLDTNVEGFAICGDELICPDRLILTPIINKDPEKARWLSEVSPSSFCGVKSHSGFITVEKEYNNNLFFWYFPHHDNPGDRPWIIWLQGGPGYSSIKGLFDINGPLRVENDKVTLRNVTWASDYSMVFVDNPVGAGFSFTSDDRGYTSDEDAVGEQLYEFLQQFLNVFPELRTAPLFLAGQSYAGKYVPALGIQIHRKKNQNKPINFMGLIIGNGLIDPHSMMNYSNLCKELGILDGENLQHLKNLEENVVQLIDEQKMVDASNKFNETIEFIKKISGLDVYNFLKDPEPSGNAFEPFVQRPDIRKLIHVGNATFTLNNQYVYEKMLPDIMNTTKPFVEELLEHYWFMSYSGQLDIIIPYALSKNMYQILNWTGKDEYLSAKRVRVRSTDNNRIIAYKRSGGKFVDVLVRGAGHSVPADQPEAAKFLIDKFIAEVINKSTIS